MFNILIIKWTARCLFQKFETKDYDCEHLRLGN